MTNQTQVRLVAAYLDGAARLETARTAVAGAKGSALDFIRQALADVAPIFEATWDATWKEPVAAALIASGRYSPRSVPPKVAALKVVCMGLTNGLQPREGDTIKLYEDFARQQMARRGDQLWNGIYTPKPQGAKQQDHVHRQAKAEQRAFCDACDRVALVAAPETREAFAGHLATILSTPEGRGRLRELVADLAWRVQPAPLAA